MPDKIADLLAHVAPGASVRASAQSDLAPDGRFGERWVVLTDDRLLVVEQHGGEPRVETDLPLKGVSEFKIENLVGGGVLQAVVDGHERDLVSYTNALSKQFADVRGQLDAAVKDKPIPEAVARTFRCPSCGMVLGERTRVCPRCVHRAAMLRRLLSYASPYRGRLTLVSLLMIFTAAFGLVPPWLTKILVDDVLIPKSNAHLLVWLVLGLLVSNLFSTGLAIWRGRLSAWLGGRVSFDIRAELYERLQWMSMRYFDHHPTGALVSRLTQDSGGIQDFLAFGLPWILSNLIIVLGVVAAIFAINWQLAILVLLPAPLVMCLVRALWRRVHRAFHKFWYGWHRFHTIVNDALGRVKIIKAFTREPDEIERFRLRNADLFGASLNAEQTFATFFPIIGFAVTSGSLLVWYFGSLIILGDGGLSIGGLMAFLAYLAMLYGPLNGLAQSAQWMSRAMTAAERVFEVFDSPDYIEPSAEARPPLDLRGEIEFRDVSFGYEKSQPVLKEVSFTVEPNTMIGLVGKSGVGKTTIINLLCRFYDPDEGTVLVDGTDLKNFDLSEYRKHIGVVLQEPLMFSGTIAENIAYGRPDATPEEIIAAAKAANAHEFIVKKPDGYDEQVGQRGDKLSAGEKQRLSIARAILRNPTLLILDEATANVDLETEEQIQTALARLIKGRTVFAIAHRLSTLRNADKLLVLDEGKVAEFGTHEDLAKKKDGVYTRLLNIFRKTSRVRIVNG
ncbi:MAG: ABC transporter ATP-binding protein/permease [Armatimonadetes bacterium]|nr:ABC transporter ATP-binding protein/permease [Armatimonadota bacterium]